MNLLIVLLVCAASYCCATRTYSRNQMLSAMTSDLYGRGSSYRRRMTVSRPSSGISGASHSLLESIYGRETLDKLTSSSSSSSSLGGSSPFSNSPEHPVCNPPPVVCTRSIYRTADGTCNNPHNPTWGSIGWPQVRMLPSQYQDGRQRPRTFGARYHILPSPRQVSQALHSADNVAMESSLITHMFTVWGQFLDHDITHTPVAKQSDGTSLDCCDQPVKFPSRDQYWIIISQGKSIVPQRNPRNPNCFPITMYPSSDRFFKHSCMNFVRSKAFAPSTTCPSVTREQGNTQTAFIDGSQVYGPKLSEQIPLRSGIGGQLKSAEHDLLPRNSTTMCTKRPNTRDFCFASGDPRVNEHPMLSTLHTVFHRLHNLLASKLSSLNPHWDDETLFQEARKILGAILQHMTYAEYLPLVLGDREMDNFNLTLGSAANHRYNPDVNPTIINAFSTAAFRFGHSMVNGFNTYGYNNRKINLRDMFFHPHFLQSENGAGLEKVLYGLLRDHSQSGDRFMNKDLTDHLFENKGARSLDLASLNIQRGRDHGLPSYNEYRKVCGLTSIQDAVKTGELSDVPFRNVYSNLDDVDLFTGGLAEPPLPGGVVGPTFSCIIATQFRNIKFGDRFWYQNTQHEGALTAEQIRAIEKISLSDVLCWTTHISAVQEYPFMAASNTNPVKECFSVLPVDLSAWLEL